MRIVLQRVKRANVIVQGKQKASIGKGFLLLVGISKEDTAAIGNKMAQKIAALRVFEDSAGKMNLDIRQTGGEVLSIPQFTLLANTGKGNRPGFDGAAPPADANAMWKHFNDGLRAMGVPVFEGVFGARMEVNMLNDGPVTFLVDSK